MAATLRVTKYDKDHHLVVLCPMGHVIDSCKIDNYFAGSALQETLSRHCAGKETHWDRSADKCRGAGH